MQPFLNQTEVRKAFKILLTLGDALPLDHAAFLIAKEEYPGLDVRSYLRRLDIMAGELDGRIADHENPEGMIDAIREYFFDEKGFQGNEHEYYDPRNSFLNEVIDRKTGIPITLATIMMTVCRRLDIRATGVGMPGHFLLRIRIREYSFLLDPFREGQILTADDCVAMFNRLYQGAITFQERMLDDVSRLELLYRMLANLKGIYLQTEEHSKALAVVERMLLIAPGSVMDLRDRGLLYYRLGFTHQAIRDLGMFLAAIDQTNLDRAEVEKIVRLLRPQVMN